MCVWSEIENIQALETKLESEMVEGGMNISYMIMNA